MATPGQVQGTTDVAGVDPSAWGSTGRTGCRDSDYFGLKVDGWAIENDPTDADERVETRQEYELCLQRNDRYYARV